MKIKKFIEENFLIDDARTGKFVRFIFNPVQDYVYKDLVNDYGENLNFDGARRLYLKARKEGCTSLFLAIFAALDITSKYACRSLEISYKDDATKQHFRRYKNYCLSLFEQDTNKWDNNLEKKIFSSITDGTELVFASNKASFYVGTASTRTGERGGTVQKILFSETAHYPNTGIIKANEIIDGTSSMVPVGTGIIIHETTANGYTHFKTTWDMAKRGEINFKPIFLSWKLFYSESQFEIIKKSFTDKSLIPQEYPENEHEAFIASGNCAFDKIKLAEKYQKCSDPIAIGYLLDDGKSVKFIEDKNSEFKIWKRPRFDRKYLVSADPCQGTVDGDFAVAHVLDQDTLEQVAVYRKRIDPGEFGTILITIGQYYNFASLIPEINNHGWATKERIVASGYPHLIGSANLWQGETNIKDVLGFPSNKKTKNLYIATLQECILDDSVILNDIITVQELLTFIRNGETFEAQEGCYDDCVTSLGIGIYSILKLQININRFVNKSKFSNSKNWNSGSYIPVNPIRQ